MELRRKKEARKTSLGEGEEEGEEGGKDKGRLLLAGRACCVLHPKGF